MPPARDNQEMFDQKNEPCWWDPPSELRQFLGATFGEKKLWLLLGVCHSIPSWWLVWVNISILPFYKKVGQLRTSMTEVKGKEITQISLHDICSAPGRWSMYAHGSSGWSWIRSWNSLQELQGTRHWKLPKQAHEKYQHWKYNSTSLG